MSEIEQRSSSVETLHSLLSADAKPEEIDAYLASLASGETARAVSRLEWELQERLLTQLDPADAAALVVELCEVQAADLFESLDPAAAAEILHEIPSAERVDLLGEISEFKAETILHEMTEEDKALARRLKSYDPQVAGGLMITELVSYPAGESIGEVVRDLRKNTTVYRDYEVQYLYIVDDRSRRVGVLPLRSLLQAEDDELVESVMIPDPLTVQDESLLEDLDLFFDRHHFLAVPVVDGDGRLVGVVHNEAVQLQCAVGAVSWRQRLFKANGQCQ